jgi:NRAMP (natural resistance-associated macrophage protein)-like metal ion transporter
MDMEKLKGFFRMLGPGFVTGAADDDPSGIGTYSQTGAQFGYSQLWLALFSFPFMLIVQEMCGRLGLVSGKGISRLIKKHYPNPLLYGLVLMLLVANVINIGADLGAMAESMTLLLGFPHWVWLVIITVVSLFLQIMVPYRRYSNILKYLTLSLLAYIITAFVLKLDWKTVGLAMVMPYITFSKDYLMNIVAILGTTISPYLFFWQASEEVECLVKEDKLKAMSVGTPDPACIDIREMRVDTTVGMFFSQIVMFFIIVTAAATLNANHITHIDSAAKAAQALKPIAGNFAYWLFAAGIIGTGLLAVPVLAGSGGYAVAEALGWSSLGLYKKPQEAKRFYTVIAVCVLLGFLINFVGIPPFQMLYYTAIFNGLCAPPLMVLILLLSNNRSIMGDNVNSRVSNIIGWTIAILMGVCAIALLTQLG